MQVWGWRMRIQASTIWSLTWASFTPELGICRILVCAREVHLEDYFPSQPIWECNTSLAINKPWKLSRTQKSPKCFIYRHMRKNVFAKPRKHQHDQHNSTEMFPSIQAPGTYFDHTMPWSKLVLLNLVFLFLFTLRLHFLDFRLVYRFFTKSFIDMIPNEKERFSYSICF